MKNIRINIDSKNKKQNMPDMFGIFFEDINHAADGGLYGEMVRNRSFEFDKIDNQSYNAMTSWKVSGVDEGGYVIETKEPYAIQNPHYITINLGEANFAALENEGYNTGFYIEEGKEYNFSMIVKTTENVSMAVFVEQAGDKCTEELTENICAREWTKVKLSLKGIKRTIKGRLKIEFRGKGSVSADHISLFPRDTFLGKENGMRKDIAELLRDLKPRFMRFPGGCLVHDGSLNADDRDSMYRWENTIGEVEKRPARRSNWGYNQTLGLGYYEYFCFCEDIGAKPLPVLPGGYNPHRQLAVPVDELQPWIDEALDLIEFANGDETTKWGKIRAELGHREPFNLEYLAIGNEEVGEKFFERYPYFHKAIKEKYPEIKLIGSSGPFAAGGEFERGWKSARENNVDLVDEHYYMAPEWFMANMDRYSQYDENGPKVFLGEYATWGNTYYNALVEAAYMVKMQENAATVGLACYAPLLNNVDYTNWKPDLIWYNNHQAFGSANYYVQKMFMVNQGDYLLDTKTEGNGKKMIKPVDFSGEIALEAVDGKAQYSDIVIINNDNGEKYSFDDVTLTEENKKKTLMNIDSQNYTIIVKAKQPEGRKGFIIGFGEKGEGNRYYWELGAWQNLDAAICHQTNGRGSCLTQSEFSVDFTHTYEFKINVTADNVIEGYVDGKLFQTVTPKPVEIEELYVTSALCDNGDIVIKCVNLDDEAKSAVISVEGLEKANGEVTVEEIKNMSLDSENTFDEPEKVKPVCNKTTITNGNIEYIFEKQSITVFRIS